MGNEPLNIECLYSAYILPVHCVTIDLISSTPIYGQAVFALDDKPLSGISFTIFTCARKGIISTLTVHARSNNLIME